MLFSSHQLDVVERLCDDLVIIANGQVRAAGSREALREQYSGSRWELEIGGDAGWVRGIPGVAVAELAGTTVLFDADTTAADSVLRAAVERGSVMSFRPVRPTLGEIFRDIVVDSSAKDQSDEQSEHEGAAA